MKLMTINFNSFPNEMLRTVLGKLKVQQLILIRVVCKKWMVIMENICCRKRSIVLEEYGLVTISKLTEQFNGLVDFSKDCVVLKMKSYYYQLIPLSSDFSNLLAKLFPRVENLLFDVSLERTIETCRNLLILLNHWSSSIVTLKLPTFYELSRSHLVTLSDQIDNLAGLKRLSYRDVEFLKQTTFDRLEHYSTFEIYTVLGIKNKLDCKSLYFDGHPSLSEITELSQLNAQLVKDLTHLGLGTSKSGILSYVCANFVSLQMLNIEFLGNSPDRIFNADMAGHLARLANLSQLSIREVSIDLTTLARTNLASVQILSMSSFDVQWNDDDDQFDGDQFCRVLSSVFSNLQQLTIKHGDGLVRNGVSQHLNHFVHLSKHLITSTWP